MIRNSFEPALRPPAQPRAARPTIVHFGNCYGPRTLAPVLRAIAELRRRGSATGLRLLNLGRVRESDLQLAERLGVRDCLEYRPMLPYAEALRVLSSADLQLLLGYGTETGHVPAKFFDYLLSGAPILCVARQGELTRLVDDTGRGRCAATDEIDAIAETIAAATRRPADERTAPQRTRPPTNGPRPHTRAPSSRTCSTKSLARGSARSTRRRTATFASSTKTGSHR